MKKPAASPAQTRAVAAQASQPSSPLIADALAEFALSLEVEEIPQRVRERAKHLILDALGIALASSTFDYAHRTLSAVQGLAGAGECTVIGMPAQLPLRDAVLVNGVIVHGLDYDDTHVPGVIHTTASTLPTALGVAEHLGASGRDLLAAYIVGTETAARLGAVAKGGFHQVGFHPTGLVGAFGCTLLAGRLYETTPAQLAMAQGIVLSMAAGSFEFLQDGAWTKRMHPGWAGQSAITAVALARGGFSGPRAAYEGRFGLYKSHLGPAEAACDYGLATAGLREAWELEQVAVKPFPACHFTHGCADAALALVHEQGVRPQDVTRVRALIAQEVVSTVCEPRQNKYHPVSDYDAKFSLPYVIAASMVRGRFGLAELEPAAMHDPEILALTQKVEYEIDPHSGFPQVYSGEVIVQTRDGKEYRHREQVNRGAADRPLSNAEIVAKYDANAVLGVSARRAAQIRELVLNLDELPDAGLLAAALGG